MHDFSPAEEPMTVNHSAMPAQLMSLLRDAIAIGTAWAIGKGYIDSVTGTQIAGVLVVLGNVAWRQLVTHRTHRKLVTAAEAAPAYVAVVK